MARFTPVRIGKLLACVLLQIAFLFAVSPASASLVSPCHHHNHRLHAAAGPALVHHVAADHPSSSDSDHRGHCMTCCLGGACSGAWLSPSGSVGAAASVFHVVRFTPLLTWGSTGHSALPALPPPRRIA